MKKVLLMILVLGLVLSSFAACDNSDKDNENGETDNSQHTGDVSTTIGDSYLVNLSVSWWGEDDRNKTTVEAIELFAERNPVYGIDVEYGSKESWKEKTTLSIASDNSPDIIQIDHEMFRDPKNTNAFYNLDSVININQSNWDDSVLELGRIDSNLRAIAVSADVYGIFYNKAAYEVLDIELPKTWDDLASAGALLNSSSDKKYPFDFDPESGLNGFYLAIAHEQQISGHNFINSNSSLGFSEGNIKSALDFYMTLESSHIIPTAADRTARASKKPLYKDSDFTNGNIAGVLEWSSSISEYEKALPNQLVVGTLPIEENAGSSGWFVKPSLLFAISANSDFPNEAGYLLNWLLNNQEANEILGTTRGIPYSKAAVAALEESGQLDSLSASAMDSTKDYKPVSISPYMDNNEIRIACMAAIESVSSGKTSSEDTAKSLHSTISNILATNKLLETEK